MVKSNRSEQILKVILLLYVNCLLCFSSSQGDMILRTQLAQSLNGIF